MVWVSGTQSGMMLNKESTAKMVDDASDQKKLANLSGDKAKPEIAQRPSGLLFCTSPCLQHFKVCCDHPWTGMVKVIHCLRRTSVDNTIQTKTTELIDQTQKNWTVTKVG